MLVLERHPAGPRVWIFGLRVHHGLSGLAIALAGAGAHDRRLIALGLALALDDAHDFPWRLRERANP